MLKFWLGTSSKNIHKSDENTNVCSEEGKYWDCNIFGQYAYNGSNDGRTSYVQRQCNLPPPIFGFCLKPGEVHFECSLGNRVPWDNNKLFENVSVFTTTKDVKNSESMSRYSCQRPGF